MKDAGIIGFVPRGEYSDTETYDFLQFVYYGDSSYVAKKETTGNKPAENNEYWQLLAKGRVLGVSGVKGEKETTYRTGDVNLTAANVGALPLTGGILENRTPEILKLKNTNADTLFLRMMNSLYTISLSLRSPSEQDVPTLGISDTTNDKMLFNLSSKARKIYDSKTNGLRDILVQGDNIGDCIVNGKKLNEWLK